MTAPSVKAVNISPTSVGMVWSSINVPVDSWVVVERAISKPINGSNGSIQVREVCFRFNVHGRDLLKFIMTAELFDDAYHVLFSCHLSCFHF